MVGADFLSCAELNKLIKFHEQGLFDTTQDIMKKSGISHNINDYDENNRDEFEMYEKLLDTYHEYDNDLKSDILALIVSHPKLSKFATV